MKNIIYKMKKYSLMTWWSTLTDHTDSILNAVSPCAVSVLGHPLTQWILEDDKCGFHEQRIQLQNDNEEGPGQTMLH